MPGDWTARRLGIRTVAVYSDADAKALHVRMADEAVHIGPSPAPESYLRGDKIIEAAKATGAEAVHPGYGFLSENAAFAQAVIDAGLVWIGPKPGSIRAMGLKDSCPSGGRLRRPDSRSPSQRRSRQHYSPADRG